MSRRIILLFLHTLAEAALIAPFAIWFIPAQPPIHHPTAIVVICALLVAIALQWLMFERSDTLAKIQRVVMGGWLIGMFIIAEIVTASLDASFTINTFSLLPGFLLALFIWWRGMALGQNDFSPRSTETHFYLGALFLIVTSLALIFAPRINLLAGALLFFIPSFFALPISHLEHVDQSPIGRQTRMRGWWRWVVFVVFCVVAISVLVTSLATGTPIQTFLLVALGVLILPFVLIVSLIPQSFYDWLAELLRRIRLPTFPAPGANSLESLFNANQTPSQNFTGVNIVIAVIVFGALAFFVLLLMSVTTRKNILRRKSAEDFEAPLKSSETRDDILKSAISSLDIRRWLATLTIRRLYVRAVREAGKRGFTRSQNQTPMEFLPKLNAAFPDAERETRQITDAYIAAHYGEVPDTLDGLNTLRSAWLKMRKSKP